MLIRFNVENVLSFKERQSFSMIAGRSGRNKAFHLIEKTNKQDISLLKTAVAFGANASGKSNLVKAIELGKKLIVKGRSTRKNISYQPFRLDESSLSAPSRIEYEIKHKGKSYAYGFVFDSKRIIEEWLFEISKNNEKLIFKRTGTTKFNLEPLYIKNSPSKEKQFLEFTAQGTPDNQLFLTELNHRRVKENISNISDVLDVYNWFDDVLTIIYPSSRNRGIEFDFQDNSNNLSLIFESILKYFDTGICGISLEEVDFDKIQLPESIKESIEEGFEEKNKKKHTAWIENPIDKIRYILLKN